MGLFPKKTESAPTAARESAKSQDAPAAAFPRPRADDDFAHAVWFQAIDDSWREQNGGSASTRVARIISHGTASGLTAGQLAALKRLAERVEKAADVLGMAERRRASGRLNVVPGGNGRNF